MRRYVLAGASSRALHMYALPVVERYRDSASLVGVWDVNTARAEYISRECGGKPVYSDFDAMLNQAAPDTVVVTTVDRPRPRHSLWPSRQRHFRSRQVERPKAALCPMARRFLWPPQVLGRSTSRSREPADSLAPLR